MNGGWVRRLPALALLLLLAAPAAAHEMETAHWRLVQRDALHWDSVLQLPTEGGRVLSLTPELPPGCEAQDDLRTAPAIDGLRVAWTIRCEGALVHVGLDGFSIMLPDAYVEAVTLDGRTQHGVLSIDRPRLSLEGDAAPLSLAHYLALGVHHILLGPDHLLFVVGLFVLWWRRGDRVAALVGIVTAFTVAHSLTLALSALDLVQLPMRGVEAVIALSILLLACELVIDRRDSLVFRHLPAVAFGFGLMHGFGFADALRATGLPADSWLWALALFNIGVELGQLLIVAVLLLLVRHAPPLPHWAPAALCVYGGLAAYWTLDRSLAVLA